MEATDKRDEINRQIIIDFKEALDDEARRKKWEPKIGGISQNRSGCKGEDDPSMTPSCTGDLGTVAKEGENELEKNFSLANSRQGSTVGRSIHRGQATDRPKAETHRKSQDWATTTLRRHIARLTLLASQSTVTVQLSYYESREQYARFGCLNEGPGQYAAPLHLQRTSRIGTPQGPGN
ncbi:hypothetical protein CFIO01_01275 [Colletotrichum fioriniae PJ7]|uniref:Uncharacterized protein n=1 Tax=Colletotrichum fioriniae PJ7 TaxID=1445577 RepID=A0A010R2F7_9PEZI|nr:hypothetical protein CFIO01_01275 [Colletotrichum fioriniae PJ7]